jgi:DNA-binding MarR family transcriptional regulator/RimJ/RimL family protein N-acetyltransferase
MPTRAASPEIDAQVDALRRFNRAWSQRIGALDDSFLGTGRSLGASRLLFEMGADGAGLLDLRRRLGLDSGYLSRLLRGLEDDGLVEVRSDPADRRRRVVVPTPAGRRAVAQLEQRSEQRAADLVAPLGDAQRRRLTEALDTAGRLIRAATVVLEPVSAGSPAAVGAVRRYFDELDRRFPDGFDAGDAATADVAAMSPPAGGFLVGRIDGEVIACGGVQRHSRTVGEVKRMWIAPEWRGCGLGARMLAALEDEVLRLGYREVYLDTNSTLVEAIALYQRSGYRAIERYNDNPYARHWFAKRLPGTDRR